MLIRKNDEGRSPEKAPPRKKRHSCERFLSKKGKKRRASFTRSRVWGRISPSFVSILLDTNADLSRARAIGLQPIRPTRSGYARFRAHTPSHRFGVKRADLQKRRRAEPRKKRRSCERFLSKKGKKKEGVVHAFTCMGANFALFSYHFARHKR